MMEVLVPPPHPSKHPASFGYHYVLELDYSRTLREAGREDTAAWRTLRSLDLS